MNGAAVLVVVGGLALAGLAPWWRAGEEVPRRAAALVAGGRDGATPGCDGPGVPCDPAVVLALLAAGCRSGASLPRVLAGVGRALEGPEGLVLCRAAERLELGASWGEAWTRSSDAGATNPEDASRALAVTVADALAPTWTHGAAPGPALRAAAEQVRRERAERATQAAGRLGVRLVLPLGLCYLPAFVLVGIVPVLVAYGVGALR